MPAGIRTTVLLGAEDKAALRLAAVTVPPYSVLHCCVTQFAQVALGIPPGIPAWLQSIARLGARMPDQGAAWATRGAAQSVMQRTSVLRMHLVMLILGSFIRRWNSSRLDVAALVLDLLRKQEMIPRA